VLVKKGRCETRKAEDGIMRIYFAAFCVSPISLSLSLSLPRVFSSILFFYAHTHACYRGTLFESFERVEREIARRVPQIVRPAAEKFRRPRFLAAAPLSRSSSALTCIIRYRARGSLARPLAECSLLRRGRLLRKGGQRCAGISEGASFAKATSVWLHARVSRASTPVLRAR